MSRELAALEIGVVAGISEEAKEKQRFLKVDWKSYANCFETIILDCKDQQHRGYQYAVEQKVVG